MAVYNTQDLTHEDRFIGIGQNLLSDPSFEDHGTASLAQDPWFRWYSSVNIWVMPYVVNIDESFARTGTRSVKYRTDYSAGMYQYVIPINPWHHRYYAGLWVYVPKGIDAGCDVVVRIDFHYTDGTVDYVYAISDHANRIQGSAANTDGWEYHWGYAEADETKSIEYISYYIVNNTFNDDIFYEWWVDDCFLGEAERIVSAPNHMVAGPHDDSGDELTEYTTDWTVTANSNLTRDTTNYKSRNASLKLDHGTRTDYSQFWYSWGAGNDLRDYQGIRLWYRSNVNTQLELRCPDWNNGLAYTLDATAGTWVEKRIPFEEFRQLSDSHWPKLEDFQQVVVYMSYGAGTDYVNIDGMYFYKELIPPEQQHPRWMVESYGEDFLHRPVIGSTTAIMTDEGTESDSGNYTKTNCTMGDNTSIMTTGSNCLWMKITTGTSAATAYGYTLSKKFYWKDFSHVEFWYCKAVNTHIVDQLKVRIYGTNKDGLRVTMIAQLNIGRAWSAANRWYRFRVPKEAFLPDYTDRTIEGLYMDELGWSIDANHGADNDTHYFDDMQFHLKEGACVNTEMTVRPYKSFDREYGCHTKDTLRSINYTSVIERYGQVFTATHSGFLRGIMIQPGSNVGSPTGDVYATLIAVSGTPALPTGNGWQVHTISAEDWDTHANELLFVPFNWQLTVGTQYCIFFYTTPLSTTNVRYVWVDATSPPYDDGYGCSYNGTSWVQQSGDDMRFHLVWGIPDEGALELNVGPTRIRKDFLDVPTTCEITLREDNYGKFYYYEDYSSQKHLTDLWKIVPPTTNYVVWENSSSSRMNLKDDGEIIYKFKFPWTVTRASMYVANSATYSTEVYIGDGSTWFLVATVGSTPGTTAQVNLYNYVNGTNEFYIRFVGDDAGNPSYVNEFFIEGQLDMRDTVVTIQPGSNPVNRPFSLSRSDWAVMFGDIVQGIRTYTDSRFALTPDVDVIEDTLMSPNAIILWSRKTAYTTLDAFKGREQTTWLGVEEWEAVVDGMFTNDDVHKLEDWKDAEKELWLMTFDRCVRARIVDINYSKTTQVGYQRIKIALHEIAA